jgi:hypothetical protein
MKISSQIIPCKVVTIGLPVTEQVYDFCNKSLHKIGESRSEKLEFVPAHIKVIEKVRPKYACKQCEKTGTANHIKTAQCPQHLFQWVLPRQVYSANLSRSNTNMFYRFIDKKVCLMTIA